MIPIRSFMFVPGHRQKFIDGLPSGQADAVILDLEDSVPPTEKKAARALVASKIGWLAENGQRVYVRANKSAHLYDYDDLMAIVQPGLEGLVLAMPQGPEDVALCAAIVSEAEDRADIAPGSTRLVPALETPRSLQLAYEVAQHPRVDCLIGAFAKGADLARAMGMEWSEEGRESLYLKSRVVMAARAAGKVPIGGCWQQIHDLDGLARFCEGERQLGFAGTTILHPSNAAPANRAFSPSAAQLDYYRAMIAHYDRAKAEGLGSVMFGGEHIDKAHVETARDVLSAYPTDS